MRILLISPPKETIYGTPRIPRLGPAYLSGSLKSHGIDHEILDLNLYKDWKKALITKLKKFDLFGITSTTFEFDAAKEVAKYIKKHAPHSIIILGGPHATLMGKEVLQNCNEIDYCIRGEGEESLVKLIHLIESEHEREINSINGICYREQGEVKSNSYSWINNLDDIPFPNYDKFELDKYAGFPRRLSLLTSRGCPFSCIYCSVGIIMGRKFRKRSSENIINEMEYFLAKYGTSFFQFQDDNFTLDIKRTKEICKCIINKGLNIRWSVPNGIRIDKIDEELVDLMKRSGCIKIAIGIESINNDILRNLKRGISRKSIERGISIIKNHEIPIKGFFIVGSPGETKKDIYDYLEFAIQQGLKEAGFNMLTPYPHTELWNWVENNGYWVVENPLEEITKYTHIEENTGTIYETPSFTREEKEKVHQEIREKWEKYKLGKTLKGKIILRMRKYPHVYHTVREMYQLSKTFGKLNIHKRKVPEKRRNMSYKPKIYWEQRAKLYKDEKECWSVICLQGAPEFFNKFRDHFQKLCFRKLLDKYISTINDAGGLALDIGCGAGRFSQLISNKNFYPIGIDLTKTMTEIAKKRTGISAIQANATNLPFKDNVFNLAVSITVLQHLPYIEQEAAIQEMYRVTKHEGGIILIELMDEKDKAFHVFPRSRDKWIQLIQRAGSISIVDEQKEGYLLLARIFGLRLIYKPILGQLMTYASYLIEYFCVKILKALKSKHLGIVFKVHKLRDG